MKTYDDDIFALATPFARSALAIIRTTGSSCIQRIAKCLANPEKLNTANTIFFTKIFGENQELLDEVTCAVFYSPRSYTGEDSVEIYCHGSLPGIEIIMQRLLSLGFRRADPGEFTLRAFLAGKLDLTIAEAVQEIVQSQSKQAQSFALKRLSGAVFNEINRIKQVCLDAFAIVTVQLDYPEDELRSNSTEDTLSEEVARKVSQAMQSLDRLSASYRVGRLYQEGAKIVLAGQTNAGKSSLFNRIIREDRAIVSSEHGTTRDYLEVSFEVGGIPIHLFDTAGFRDGAGEIQNSNQIDDRSSQIGEVESEGMRRSDELLRSADLILYLVDGSDYRASASDEIPLPSTIPCIRLWTKSDIKTYQGPPNGYLAVSALTGDGMQVLFEAMEAELRQGSEDIGNDELVIDSLRQKELIDRALESLQRVSEQIDSGETFDIIALDLDIALKALGEITGEVSSEEILDQIFAKFCLGK